MRQMSARDIFAIGCPDILNFPNETVSVTYDDGVVVECRQKQVIFNRYCWLLFELYPNTPIPSTCDVGIMLGDKFFNGSTHITLLQTVFKHIAECNGLKYYHQKENLLRLTQITVNRILNEIVHNAGEYVTNIDAVDFAGTVADPVIEKMHLGIKPYPEYIENGYRTIRNYVETTPNPNQFVRAYRAKSVNENQANQCIGPIGFVTELDRTVFKTPIQSGFIRGLKTLFEIIIESIKAAKALNANGMHIQTSEYASRRVQILTMTVGTVFNGDCGSQEYFSVHLTPNLIANMKGKYYLNEETGELDYIRGDEKHLESKLVKVRTALGCRHNNAGQVCTTCLGRVSENFPENSNLGYTMTSHLMEKLTQAILSTKHLIQSIKKSLIQLSPAANRYFYADEDNNIFFNKDMLLKGKYLILPNSQLAKLVDVLSLQHTNISLTKIGELDMIGIKDTNHKTHITESVSVAYKDRHSSITRELLDHIKSSNMETDARGNFVIPLDNWDLSKPVFNNPLKETNIISFINKVANMIEENKGVSPDPYEKLDTLFSIITDQLKCNMTVVEVIVYATTTYNSYNGNYGLGRNSIHPKCVSNTLLFRHRSAAQFLCYEDQMREILNNPVEMFAPGPRAPHPMDVLFHPSSLIT